LVSFRLPLFSLPFLFLFLDSLRWWYISCPTLTFLSSNEEEEEEKNESECSFVRSFVRPFVCLFVLFRARHSRCLCGSSSSRLSSFEFELRKTILVQCTFVSHIVLLLLIFASTTKRSKRIQFIGVSYILLLWRTTCQS
jgi:hypothetical protein